jgi:hypothetical protein
VIDARIEWAFLLDQEVIDGFQWPRQAECGKVRYALDSPGRNELAGSAQVLLVFDRARPAHFVMSPIPVQVKSNTAAGSVW